MKNVLSVLNSEGFGPSRVECNNTMEFGWIHVETLDIPNRDILDTSQGNYRNAPLIVGSDLPAIDLKDKGAHTQCNDLFTVEQKGIKDDT